MKQTELDYFKKILEQRRVEILQNINNQTNDISSLRETCEGDEFDIASVNVDLNLKYSIASQQKAELDDIENCLKKIHNFTYGICEMCEDEISLPRLKAKPTARLCITCKEISEKNKRN